MSELLTRWVPGQTWVRAGVTLSPAFQPGHSWLYGGLVRRDAWRIGRVGLYLIRMPKGG